MTMIKIYFSFPQKYVRAVPFKGVEGGGTDFFDGGGRGRILIFLSHEIRYDFRQEGGC